MVAAALACAGCKRQKPPKLVRVWLGAHEGCAETSTGTLSCWPGTRTFEGKPREIVFGGLGACALYEGGELVCDGKKVEDVKAAAVAVGREHACAADTSSGVVLSCWGKGKPTNLRVAGGELLGLAAGDRHTCVSATDSIDDGHDAVLCFGDDFGPPRAVMRGDRAIALAAGAEHTCALMANTTVRCWGKNDFGQIGDGSKVDAPEPVTVPGVTGAVQVAAGDRFTCVRLRSRTVSCWGDNRRHQLANGTTEPSAAPVALHGLVGVEEIAAAGDSACARLADGDVRCWGANDEGQLGDGTRQEHNVPTSVRIPRR